MFSKEIIRAGNSEASPTEGSKIKVNLVGIIDSKQFTSTLATEPIEFILGQHQVIKGIELAVATMKKNELAKIEIPAELAHGDEGFPPLIPGSATLQLNVELLDFDNTTSFYDGQVIKTTTRSGANTGTPKYESLCNVQLKCVTSDGHLIVDTEEHLYMTITIGASGFNFKALDECIKTMSKGSSCTLTVPSHHARGAAGWSSSVELIPIDSALPHITTQVVVPPNADLVCHIVLLDFVKTCEAKKAWMIDSFEDLLAEANLRKTEGNTFFQTNQYRDAILKYNRVFDLIDIHPNLTADEVKEVTSLKSMVHLNICACYIQLKELKKALQSADNALTLLITVKGLWRRGCILSELGSWERARDDFLKALQMDPENKSVKSSLSQLRTRENQPESISFKKMFQ